MLTKAVVVCILLALFSTGLQGNKEANVDNHHLAAWKEPVPRFVSQPTVSCRDSETCLPGSDKYYRRLGLLLCDEKYIQAVFNEIETSNCSNVYYNDTLFFSGCGTNHNGVVCGSIPLSKYNECDYTNDCSSGCRTMFRQLSDSVGCCIHDNYDLRIPSLWMKCNIQQPEICADTPNIAGILAKIRNVDSCTKKCSLKQNFYVFCKYLGEEYEQINRECGLEDVVYYCGFDKGEFCVEMYYPISYFEVISDECYSDSEEGNVRDGVCSTNCKNGLVEFIDTVGCCFNFFNSTFPKFGSSTSPGLSSDLFSLCGIEFLVPDACKSFNSTAVPDDFLECAGRTINTKLNNTISTKLNNTISTKLNNTINTKLNDTINCTKVNNTINSKVNNTSNTSGAALQSRVYNIGLIIIGLIGTYI